jgi:hypothetical protein
MIGVTTAIIHDTRVCKKDGTYVYVLTKSSPPFN